MNILTSYPIPKIKQQIRSLLRQKSWLLLTYLVKSLLKYFINIFSLFCHFIIFFFRKTKDSLKNY